MVATLGRILNPNDVPGVIRRNRRETTFPSVSTWTTTETLVMAIDDITVRAGKLYRISASVINMLPSVVNDVPGVRLRYREGGAVSVAVSTSLSLYRTKQTETAQTDVGSIFGFYSPGSDMTNFSVGLTLQRFGAGASSTGVRLYGTAGDPVDLVVELMGDDPGIAGRLL
jgi:hypothetical protein